jgi:hypothetical protein
MLLSVEDMLNTLMAVYDSLIIEDKNRIAVNTMNFIDDRLSSLRDSLGGVEGNLRSFMERNGIFDIARPVEGVYDRHIRRFQGTPNLKRPAEYTRLADRIYQQA